MFWTEEKLFARVTELEEYRYRDTQQISSFEFQLDRNGEVGARQPVDGEWGTIRLGDRWEGRDLYAWLCAGVKVPAEWNDGRKIVGVFDFGTTGRGHNSGFESLLYVNDQPYQGVDSNHKEVFFNGNDAGKSIQLTFRLWSGLEGMGKPGVMEHRIQRAEIGWLDESTDDLYYTGKAILATLKVLDSKGADYTALSKAMDRAFLLIDWSRPGSGAFYGSVAEARGILHMELDKIEKHSPVTVRCIGHTHIDVAWLWRLKHTREKAARSFSTVLRLMEQYPEYIFLQTQPQLYDYIKTDYPEIYEKIQERVKERRWEPEGGMWLEADCNLTSGESLVRQFLMGKRFFREEFGVDCSYLWLPDVFGYSWALPQILKKSGIDTFMTTKISWNQYNRMPNDTFRWRGIDGTEVLTHFITTPQEDQSYRWWYTYNGHILPHTVKGMWEGYRDKGINQELLLSYGYGDGGGGVNREMLEMRRRLEKMPGLPKVETGHADEFFKGLHERVNNTDQYVHTWDGELYLEYHRGTYTSQAYNKRMNRKMELLYRETEWLGVLGSLNGSGLAAYPQQALNTGWKIILRNQFHDIIPGSSIREVYEDSKKEYELAQQLAEEAKENSVSAVVRQQSDRDYTIFNNSTWDRVDLVQIPAEQGRSIGRWVDASGNELTAQCANGTWSVKVDVPSLGFAQIRFESGIAVANQSGPFQINGSEMITPFYELAWNESGQLTKLYDRKNQRDVLQTGACGNVLQVFEDKPMRYDAWDIDSYYQEKMRQVRNLKNVQTVEVGPLRAVLRFEWEYMDSTIIQNMIVYSDSARIDFATEVDWHEQQQLLKVAFPVTVRSTEATYDIQYGNVKRPTHWNTSWDAARFETVAHQWVDLSERGYGVSLLNDCKYGHDIKDNVIRLSLIKSAINPDRFADQGHHSFTYSLLPHKGDWMEGRTVEEAWKINNPLSFTKGKAVQDRFSLFRVSSDHVMIDAVKKAEDHEKVVLRVHEFSGARNTVQISSDYKIVSWQECNLMEEPVAEVGVQQGTMSFNIKPYEIKTFLVELAKV